MPVRARQLVCLSAQQRADRSCPQLPRHHRHPERDRV